jgi:hypothetical protein
MVRTGKAIALRKEKLQVQIEGTAAGSEERLSLEAELSEVKGGRANQEIHFLMVRALACLGLGLGLGCAHPNPNPNAHPNPNPNPYQVDEKLMSYSCTHTAAAWKLATLLKAPTCDAAG